MGDYFTRMKSGTPVKTREIIFCKGFVQKFDGQFKAFLPAN